MTLESNQIIGGLIGLGLVVKGIAEWWAKNRAPKSEGIVRGCLYGDSAHDDLKALLQLVLQNQIRILTILSERK